MSSASSLATCGLPEDVIESISSLSLSLSNMQSHVASFLRCPLDDVTSALTGVEYAKLNAILSYVLNALFYVNLKILGVSPVDHPVRGELERVKLYIQKVKELAQKEEKPNLRLNVEAAQRFLSSALNQDVRTGTSSQETTATEEVFKNEQSIKKRKSLSPETRDVRTNEGTNVEEESEAENTQGDQSAIGPQTRSKQKQHKHSQHQSRQNEKKKKTRSPKKKQKT